MGGGAMSYPRPRAGIYATVNGVEYQADSYPESGQVVLLSGATVPTGQCDRLVEITTRADHQGLTCQVVDIAPDGAVGLYYLGEEKATAAERGFVQVNPGTWAKTVTIQELDRYREHHADLLFEDWWRATWPQSRLTSPPLRD
jgi:hypothetical protein